MKTIKNIIATAVFLSFILFSVLGLAGIVALPGFVLAEDISVTAMVKNG